MTCKVVRLDVVLIQSPAEWYLSIQDYVWFSCKKKCKIKIEIILKILLTTYLSGLYTVLFYMFLIRFVKGYA